MYTSQSSNQEKYVCILLDFYYINYSVKPIVVELIVKEKSIEVVLDTVVTFFCCPM